MTTSTHSSVRFQLKQRTMRIFRRRTEVVSCADLKSSFEKQSKAKATRVAPHMITAYHTQLKKGRAHEEEPNEAKLLNDKIIVQKADFKSFSPLPRSLFHQRIRINGFYHLTAKKILFDDGTSIKKMRFFPGALKEHLTF